MPDCEALYLLSYLIELGVAEGENAITWQEIESWQRQTGLELQPWEIRFVKRLSEAYLSESHASRDPDAEAPWIDAPYVVSTPNVVAMRMKAAMHGLARN